MTAVTAKRDAAKRKPRAVDGWRRSILDSDLEPTGRLILLVCATYADWTTLGNIRPTWARIAQETGLGKRTVERWIPKLIKRGWLVETEKGGAPPGGKRRASVYKGADPRHDGGGSDGDHRHQIQRPPPSDPATTAIRSSDHRHDGDPSLSVTESRNEVTDRAGSRSAAALNGGAGDPALAPYLSALPAAEALKVTDWIAGGWIVGGEHWDESTRHQSVRTVFAREGNPSMLAKHRLDGGDIIRMARNVVLRAERSAAARR